MRSGIQREVLKCVWLSGKWEDKWGDEGLLIFLFHHKIQLVSEKEMVEEFLSKGRMLGDLAVALWLLESITGS